MPLLSRLYVWSIVLEPLLFLSLFRQDVTGVGGNISRIIQLMVLIGLCLRLAYATGPRVLRVRFVRLTSPLYANYTTYLVLAVVAGVMGFATGAFSLPAPVDSGATAFAGFINSSSIRPLFEYVIAVYYFVYFTVLPQFFLNTRRGINYFFRAFRTMFIACLVIGAVDFVAALFGIGLVPRVLGEWTYVGVRFHGIAGEPRDAFVYLFFALAVLHLEAHYRDDAMNRWWGAVVVTAALLTQSASGMVGLMLFAGLYALYALPVMGPRRMLQVGLVLSLVSAVAYVGVVNSVRLMRYVEQASGLWSVLDSGATIPPSIATQVASIFPLYDLTVKMREFNWLPVLLGSGLGSASVVNNHYIGGNPDLANPPSQLVRMLYESGIIGTVIFTSAFASPVRYLTRALPKKRRDEFLVFTLLVLGCFLGHRSSVAWIYLGLVIAVFRYLDHFRSSGTGTGFPESGRGGGRDPVTVS